MPTKRFEPTEARPWAVRLSHQDAAATAALRLRPQIVAGSDGEDFWLRGSDWSETLADRLRQLPSIGWYFVQPDGQLIPVGARVPAGRLPQIDWQPLSAWWKVEIPPPALPGRASRRVPLRLERTEDVREPSAILLSADVWRDYVETAPAVRLKVLSYAVCEDGRCLIRGTPLPPLPGERFVDREGLLVPLGYSWQPAVDVAVVRRVFHAEPGEVILWQADQPVERIAADSFLRVTRGSVRRMAGGRR